MDAATATKRGLTLALALLASGCGSSSEAGSAPAPSAADPAAGVQPAATLSLQLVEQSASEVVVDLVFAPAPEDERPRTAEVVVSFTPQLAFDSATALAALEDAGKTLVAQPREGGEVRTVMYSATNLDRVQAGALVRYRFRVVAPGQASLEILPRMPVFAPATANQGVMLSDPLVIGGR